MACHMMFSCTCVAPVGLIGACEGIHRLGNDLRLGQNHVRDVVRIMQLVFEEKRNISFAEVVKLVKVMCQVISIKWLKKRNISTAILDAFDFVITTDRSF